MTSPSPIDVFDALHELLHVFRIRVRTRLESLHPELTLNEMRVLIHTGHNQDLTQKDLTERSQTDKAQMARLLASLEDRGLLGRTPSAHDKRVRCLRLTEQGKTLFGQLRDLQHEVASELLQDIPMGTQAQILDFAGLHKQKSSGAKT